MPHSRYDFGRRVAAVAPLALCIALASIATTTQAAGPREGPAPRSPERSSTEPKKPKKLISLVQARPTIPATGRLMLTVVDQNGRPLERAQVDVISLGTSSSYRERAITDGLGRISFGSIPAAVNLTVFANTPAYTGTYSENIGVSQTGPSDVRVTVQTFEVPQPTPEPEPDPTQSTRGRRR